jgi:hypothetical protein
MPNLWLNVFIADLSVTGSFSPQNVQIFPALQDSQGNLTVLGQGLAFDSVTVSGTSATYNFVEPEPSAAGNAFAGQTFNVSASISGYPGPVGVVTGASLECTASTSESVTIQIPAGATSGGFQLIGNAYTLAGVSFTSSNPAVATVSATGVITAVAAGNADIQVSYDGLVAYCRVNVHP